MATDPVACATHFRHVLNAIFKHLWRFNPEPGAQQSHVPGVFGHIEAFFGAIEEQVGALCRNLVSFLPFDLLLAHIRLVRDSHIFHVPLPSAFKPVAFSSFFHPSPVCDLT
jgi:hypothetical protein